MVHCSTVFEFEVSYHYHAAVNVKMYQVKTAFLLDFRHLRRTL